MGRVRRLTTGRGEAFERTLVRLAVACAAPPMRSAADVLAPLSRETLPAPLIAPCAEIESAVASKHKIAIAAISGVLAFINITCNLPKERSINKDF